MRAVVIDTSARFCPLLKLVSGANVFLNFPFLLANPSHDDLPCDLSKKQNGRHPLKSKMADVLRNLGHRVLEPFFVPPILIDTSTKCHLQALEFPRNGCFEPKCSPVPR